MRASLKGRVGSDPLKSNEWKREALKGKEWEEIPKRMPNKGKQLGVVNDRQ